MSAQHTRGPWPIKPTGDGKRIIVGEGLVEGPNGYEVAEVYSDDCDRDEAMANARLIGAAPDLLDLAYQYRNDMRYPPAADSRERRIALIESVLAKLDARK